MPSTLTRWRETMFPPLDWTAGLLPLFSPDIRVEQVIDEGTFVVRAELPGIDPMKEVELSVFNGVLKIHAERTEEKHDKAHTEFHYGRLVRTVVLPPGALEDSGAATYKNGILEITFKLGEPQEPGRRISIETPEKVSHGKK